ACGCTRVWANREKAIVIVDFVVNRGVEVGTDAHAEIALETLLGAKYIRLSTPLPLSHPYLGELPSNDPRRTIPVSNTKTPFDVFKLTRVATEGIKELNTDELNQL